MDDEALRRVAVYLRDWLVRNETPVAGPWAEDTTHPEGPHWARKLLWCSKGMEHHMEGRDGVGLELWWEDEAWSWDTPLDCDSFGPATINEAMRRADGRFPGFVWPDDLPIDVWPNDE